jgi:arabinofuranan 3-O-arabinosyltransferase
MLSVINREAAASRSESLVPIGRIELFTTLRRTAAATGLALLGLLATNNRYSYAVIAIAAWLALALGTVFGWFEIFSSSRADMLTPANSPKVSRAPWLLWIVFSLLLVLIAQTWFKAGAAIASGDIPPPNGTAWLSRVFDAWTPSGANLGGPSLLQAQLPWAAILEISIKLGWTAEFAQRAWYTILLVGVGLSAIGLFRALQFSRQSTTVATCAYVFNAYVVSTIATNPIYLAALALLAAVPAAVLGAATGRTSKRTAAVLIGIAAPMIGYVYQNPPLAGMVIMIAMCSPLLAWAVGGRQAAKNAAVTVGLGMLLLLALSAYWIVPAAVQIGSVASQQLAPLSSWAWTEIRAFLQNSFWLNTMWSWKFPEYDPFASAYESLPLQVLKFAFPITAFSSLLLPGMGRRGPARPAEANRLRLAVPAATGALILLFISTGTNPPGNILFDRLYALPFGWLLREPGRFLMAAALFYSVMAAATMDYLFSRLHLVSTKFLSLAFEGATAAAICGVLVSAGFPLITGAVVPDKRPILPPAHVRLPDYWTEMTGFINSMPQPGVLLVLPPDDFYQMPYRWGYYGSDGFIPNMVQRPVLIPHGQGYTPAADELINAVNLAADSIVAGHWVQTERLMSTLGATLVLVRRDVQAPFAGHNIMPSTALAGSLERSPSFRLIHTSGSLELFSLRNASFPPLEQAQSFVTLDNPSPDLRVLTLLPERSAIVYQHPQKGVPMVIQAPPISTWQQEDTKFEWDQPEPAGWRYQLSVFAPIAAPAQQPGSSSKIPAFASAVVNATGKGSSLLRISLSGRSVMRNGNFESGAWGPVADCYNILGATSFPYLDGTVIPGSGADGEPILRLSAKSDSACEVQWLSWQRGPILLSLKARNVSGSPARLCVWEEGPDRCAVLPDMPNSTGWVSYRTSFLPDAGTKALALHLYADASQSGTPTVNEYSQVRAIELPGLPQFFVVGTPDQPQQSLRLVVLRQSYSPSWVGPRDSRHVLVNGLLNGWLTDLSSRRLVVTYAPTEAISAGLIISAIAVVAVLLVASSGKWIQAISFIRRFSAKRKP